MSKAILKFNLEDSDECERFEDAVNGRKWKMLSQDIDNYLREKIKYDDNLSGDVCKELELARDRISEMLIDYGLRML